MSARREFALTELLPKFEISGLDRPIDLPKALGLDTVVIDFGSGMGDHSLNLATSCPHVGVLAIDVHTVGLLEVVESAAAIDLVNIRTHHGDGMDVFKGWLSPESIDELHILFPDPWPKARHHKRRLINAAFLDLALGVLKPGGRIVFVTDDESYFASAREVFNEFENFELSFDDWDVPLTSYHQRAIRLNHKVSQLSARKI
jgi:tRNA (guanine-N7-)-methyltransferase